MVDDRLVVAVVETGVISGSNGKGWVNGLHRVPSGGPWSQFYVVPGTGVAAV